MGHAFLGRSYADAGADAPLGFVASNLRTPLRDANGTSFISVVSVVP
jgi:hypothetical protein